MPEIGTSGSMSENGNEALPNRPSYRAYSRLSTFRDVTEHPPMGAFGGVKGTSPTHQPVAQARLVALPLLPGLEAFDRRIPALSQCRIDPLQHDIVNFQPFLERDLPQSLIDRLWQVET
jgi:hypothetical protein